MPTEFAHVHEAPVTAVTVTGNGLVATASANPGIQLFDQDRLPVMDPFGHPDAVTALSYGANGWFALGLETGELNVNRDTGTMVSQDILVNGMIHDGAVTDVVFDPELRWFASSGEDGFINVWDMNTRELIRNVHAHQGGVSDLAVYPQTSDLAQGHYLFSVGADGTLKSWSMIDENRFSLEPLDYEEVGWVSDDLVLGLGAVEVFVVEDYAYAAVGRDDGLISLYEVDIGLYFSWEGDLTGHTDSVNALVARRDGSLLASASEDGSVRFWEASLTSPLLETFFPPYAEFYRWAYVPTTGELLFSYGVEGTLWKGPPDRSEPTTQFNGVLENPIIGIEADEAGRFAATVANDHSISLWDIAAGHLSWNLNDLLLGAVTTVKFSPPLGGANLYMGTALLTGDDRGGLVYWPIGEESIEGIRLEGHRDAINAVAYSPDGTRAASADAAGNVMMWNLVERTRVGEVMKHPRAVNGLAFSPDGYQLATIGDDSRVRLFDVVTQTRIGDPMGTEGSPDVSLSFSPDGRYLAVGSRDTTVSLWDLETRNQHHSNMLGHEGSVDALVFNEAGSLLASSDDKGLVKLWDVETARPIGDAFRDRYQQRAIERLYFVQDETRLMAMGPHAWVDFWRLDIEEVACQLARRNLTEEEWDKAMSKSPLSFYYDVCDPGLWEGERDVPVLIEEPAPEEVSTTE